MYNQNVITHAAPTGGLCCINCSLSQNHVRWTWGKISLIYVGQQLLEIIEFWGNFVKFQRWTLWPLFLGGSSNTRRKFLFYKTARWSPFSFYLGERMRSLLFSVFSLPSITLSQKVFYSKSPFYISLDLCALRSPDVSIYLPPTSNNELQLSSFSVAEQPSLCSLFTFDQHKAAHFHLFPIRDACSCFLFPTFLKWTNGRDCSY